MIRAAFLLAGASVRGRRRLGLVTTVAVLLVASIGMAAGLTVALQGPRLLDDAAAEADVAHLVLYGQTDALEAAAGDPSVVASAGPFATLDDIELVRDDEPVPIAATALDTPDIAVNRPPVSAGRWAATEREVVLDRSLAEDLGIAPGDTVTFDVAGREAQFAVTGTAVNFTDCFYPMCDPGRVWLTEQGFDALAGGTTPFHQLWLRFADPADADPFVAALAASGVDGIGGSDSWLDTRDDFLALDRIFGSFVSVFGLFVLLCAAVIVAGATTMRIVTRRREIGLLGAIGSAPREIAASLVVENVLLGVLAVIAGWVVAGFTVPFLQVGIGATLGPQDPAWTPLALIVPLVAMVTILVAATLVPALGAARRPVTDVIRDVPPTSASALNRHMGRVPHRLELLGVQEAAGQPVRSALVALAAAVAVVGTIASAGFIGAFERVADDPALQGDPWDLTLVRGDADPDAVVAALGDEGVASWYGETERRSTIGDQAFLAIGAAADFGSIGYRIVEGRTVEGPGEAIVGYGFLQRFDRTIGDRVDVKVGTAARSFEIVGWYRETEDSGEILRYGLADLDPDAVPEVYRVTAVPGASVTAVTDSLSAELGGQVRIAAVDTGIDDMQPFLMALRLIAAILVAMAGVNLLATLVTANRAAAGRVGVELAIGFTPRQIIGQGAAAGVTIGVLASIAGVPLGLWLFRLMADTVSRSIGVGPGWMPLPSGTTVGVIVAVALVTTAGVGALAVRHLAHRSPSDLVRAE
jgi:putative ABC transport system permease protein